MGHWLVLLITMLVAYPLLSLDQIESVRSILPPNLSHLPLDDICTTIERNLMGMLELMPSRDKSPSEPTVRCDETEPSH
jgi:predicted membrane chloride channel (bestrophin family)